MSVKRPRLAILCSATAAVSSFDGWQSHSRRGPPTDSGGAVFTVNCPGLDEFTVVATPNDASFAPVFGIGTNQVFIPYQITGVITISGQQPFEFEDVKNAPVPADALTCTFETTFTEGGMTVTITGTAVVAQQGAPE